MPETCAMTGCEKETFVRGVCEDCWLKGCAGDVKVREVMRTYRKRRRSGGDARPSNEETTMAGRKNWTEAEDAILREEWAKGRGAAQRAKDRLPERSASAVVCRAASLRLGRPRKAGAEEKTPKAKTPRAPAERKKKAPKPASSIKLLQALGLRRLALGPGEDLFLDLPAGRIVHVAGEDITVYTPE